MPEQVIRTAAQFDMTTQVLAHRLLDTSPLQRGPAHASKDDATSSTHELLGVDFKLEVGDWPGAWAEVVKPNLPWAEDHFNERVGGAPLNPAPSEAWWPHARQGNAEHKDQDQLFAHTYPERFWPREAGWDHIDSVIPHFGIRFRYGDLSDVVALLAANPFTRQAHLPVWFPEDLGAAMEGARVPCSIGYHFLLDATWKLHCTYWLRSCDFVRFMRDDLYMAGRLLQWVVDQLPSSVRAGTLTTHIDNLHCFPGDRFWLESQHPRPSAVLGVSSHVDRRSGYDFGALG